MANEILVLSLTAASIGFFHTLLGPDHYLPFIMMARARQWSRAKTSWVTFICGVGHVASSILIGIIGLALGIALSRLEAVEGSRGSIAAWFLIIFGLVYFLWGLNKARKNEPHDHPHIHGHGLLHKHSHAPGTTHGHAPEEAAQARQSITPWALFVIFALGPCEPLIPILIYPAAEENVFGVLLVIFIFGAVTIATMMAVVLFSSSRMNRMSFHRAERYIHAIAGATILSSGMAIQFLGL